MHDMRLGRPEIIWNPLSNTALQSEFQAFTHSRQVWLQTTVEEISRSFKNFMYTRDWDFLRLDTHLPTLFQNVLLVPSSNKGGMGMRPALSPPPPTTRLVVAKGSKWEALYGTYGMKRAVSPSPTRLKMTIKIVHSASRIWLKSSLPLIIISYDWGLVVLRK